MDNRQTNYIVEYPIKFVFVVHVAELNMLYAGIMTGLNNLKQSMNDWPAAKNGLEYRPELYEKVLNSMRQNAIVSIFHCWLRNLQEFFFMGGNCKNENKAEVLKRGHEFILNLFADDKALQQIIQILKKYGCLTNAIKHGFGDSFKKLKRDYPDDFFSVPDEYIEYLTIDGEPCEDVKADAPYVLQKHVDELFAATIEFWNNVPEKVVLDFTKPEDNKEMWPRRIRLE